MTEKGTISSIVFYNSENGYTVLELQSISGDTITCVGNLPALSIGETLTVTGHVATHQRYGEQLVIDEYKVENPTDKEGILRYLASGLIRGVGEATAKAIYDKFGDDTMGVIENNPAKLAEVKRISVKKAMDIANSVAELKKMQKQIMFLQKYGITTNLALKIYGTYKDATTSIVSQNPYKLIDDIDGVGFATADKIAVSMGHAADGEFRIRAAMVYCLLDSAEKQGNTYLLLDDLLQRCKQLLDLDLDAIPQRVEEILTKLVLEPTVKIFDVDGEKCIALVRFYAMEHKIATSLLGLNRDVKRVMLDVDKTIERFEEAGKLKFHSSQLSAIKSAVVNGVTVITGGPGTGKTTIVKCIVDIFENAALRVELCAPTGRASKRLAQSTRRDAKTIHRMLGVEMRDGKPFFRYNKDNPLPCDVVIVDEVSMVDVSVMYSLIRALDAGTRLILVGDKDQLPSVGAGNVLADVIRSKTVDVRYLTFIYRQSEDSLIVTNAHLINSCKMPQIDNGSKDFFFSQTDDLSVVADTVIGLVSTRLPKFTGVPSKEIQVLGAMKSGVAGVEALNKRLQDAVNPVGYTKKEIAYGKNVFRVGDRVMQIVNDYEISYVRFLGNGSTEEGQGVFNGDIGFVTEADKATGTLAVMFDDDRLVLYTTPDLANLQLAYAVTIHKSQGSEFDVVVVPLVNGPPTIINKNLLYTAITRAKKTVVLVGSKKVLGMMIRNNYVAARTTLLGKFLQDEKLRHDRFFGESPL